MIKTVTCPECGATQAIFRDENGDVRCAFCRCEITGLPPAGEEEEGLPEAEEMNEAKTLPLGQAINAEFILQRSEVETALVSSGRLRSRKYIVWIETGLLAFFIVAMAFSFLAGYKGWWGMKAPDTQSYFIFVLAAALIPFVWIMPNRNKKRILDNATSGQKISLSVYENLAEVGVADGEKWQLVFDEGFHVITQDEIIIIMLKNKQIFAIPERAFKDDELQAAKERILKGYKTE